MGDYSEATPLLKTFHHTHKSVHKFLSKPLLNWGSYLMNASQREHKANTPCPGIYCSFFTINFASFNVITIILPCHLNEQFYLVIWTNLSPQFIIWLPVLIALGISVGVVFQISEDRPEKLWLTESDWVLQARVLRQTYVIGVFVIVCSLRISKFDFLLLFFISWILCYIHEFLTHG